MKKKIPPAVRLHGNGGHLRFFIALTKVEVFLVLLNNTFYVKTQHKFDYRGLFKIC